MPRIHLKPQSPEFQDAKPRVQTRACDMPGCALHGEFRAPKDRSLSEHYWFCMDHVREYNKAWDFFSGMNESEVQDHIMSSLYGDRPTWRYDIDGAAAEALRRAAWQTYHNTEEEPPKANGSHGRHFSAEERSTPEFEALAIFELEPPVDLKTIKTRYKQLAKKHHPDMNPGDPRAEELLKSINMAYTILKLAYEKFDKAAK